jgi:ubiquinone/menaquinone biosynthesis C-methylase UbiE
MRSMLRPQAGESLLDVGCGTGHFSRRFARLGLRVSGIDPDAAAVDFAIAQGDDIGYFIGDGHTLPFPDQSFDYCVAVTSLCFVADVESVIKEMWRVSRKSVLLGLLNRNSLLFLQKASDGGYAGARWDHPGNVKRWVMALPQQPKNIQIKTAVFLPRGKFLSRLIERLVPSSIPLGAFISVTLQKP